MSRADEMREAVREAWDDNMEPDITTAVLRALVEHCGFHWIDVQRLRESRNPNDHVLANRLATILEAAGVEEEAA